MARLVIALLLSIGIFCYGGAAFAGTQGHGTGQSQSGNDGGSVDHFHTSH